jgi:hypothetical protein
MLIKKITVVLLLFFHTVNFANDVYSYTAKIRCYGNIFTTKEYISAADDTEATAEVAKILKTKDSYKGKDCKMVEVTSDKPHSQSSSGRSHLK